MNYDIVTVPFHGGALTALATPDGEYVAVKPICERLGLAWKPQYAKLTGDPEVWGIHLMVIPSTGGAQETLCLPLNRLAAWLFSISASRVQPELREALIAYQREAADVLDRHFRLREAERDAELERLLRQVERLSAFVLAFKPLWARLQALSKAGIYRDGARFMLGISRQEAWDHLEQMEELGLIDPSLWRRGTDPEAGTNDGALAPAFCGNKTAEPAAQAAFAFGAASPEG